MDYADEYVGVLGDLHFLLTDDEVITNVLIEMI